MYYYRRIFFAEQIESEKIKLNDDYYEWEMHIFFDDAFKEGAPNKYVEFLLKSVQGKRHI